MTKKLLGISPSISFCAKKLWTLATAIIFVFTFGKWTVFAQNDPQNISYEKADEMAKKLWFTIHWWSFSVWHTEMEFQKWDLKVYVYGELSQQELQVVLYQNKNKLHGPVYYDVNGEDRIKEIEQPLEDILSRNCNIYSSNLVTNIEWKILAWYFSLWMDKKQPIGTYAASFFVDPAIETFMRAIMRENMHCIVQVNLTNQINYVDLRSLTPQQKQKVKNLLWSVQSDDILIDE